MISLDIFRWLSFYEHIRSIFGFSEHDDYLSASILNSIVREVVDDGELYELIHNKKVAVVGAGPSIVNIKEIDADVIVSADGATNYLVKQLNIIPDVIVTDLDGITVYPKESIYVVLAHGDNVTLLNKVYNMKKVLPTCQVFPFGRLKLYGGFTDGDRAVVLSKFFNAFKIVLYAMDFDSEYIGRYSKPYFSTDMPMNRFKKMKLEIGKEIIRQVSEGETNDKILWAFHGFDRR